MHGYPSYCQPPTTEQIQLFWHEQEILRSISNPRIPQWIDVFAFNDILFMVQEYIPGLPLSTHIMRGRVFTEAEIKNLLQQLLEILLYLHTPGRNKPLILHRDLRLSNLILNRKKLHLIDFGLAVRPQHWPDLTLPAPPAAKASASAGSYMMRRRAFAPASDLFGAGLVAADLMDSRLPAVRAGQPVCTDDFSEFIGKLLKPGDGYPTAAAALAALRNIRLS